MEGRLIEAVIVDIDDTLYSEHDYFLSGLQAVAQLVGRHSGSDPLNCLQILLGLATTGRDRLFDRFVSHGGVRSPSAALLVRAYRTHQPVIHAFADVIPGLEALLQWGVRLGAVTDGHPTVQRAKFAALRLARLVDTVVYTSDLPVGCGKPSPIPFTVAAELLGVEPGRCVYVADDRSKDFFGPRLLGMGTIRIERKLQWPLEPARKFEAEAEADMVVMDFTGVLAAMRPAIGRLPPTRDGDKTGKELT